MTKRQTTAERRDVIEARVDVHAFALSKLADAIEAVEVRLAALKADVREWKRLRGARKGRAGGRAHRKSTLGGGGTT
ncbi:MAG: hypothetical protein ACHREM_29155 [Polyangiales bacterium]